MKRNAPQTRKTARKSTKCSKKRKFTCQEALEDEEEQISRDEETVMMLPSSLSDAEQLRTAMMTDDEDDEVVPTVGQSNGHMETAVSSKSKTINGDPRSDGDQTINGDHAADGDQSAAGEAACQQPTDEQTKTQTENNPQTVQEDAQQAADSTRQSNGLDEAENSEDSEDFFVSLDSHSEPSLIFLTASEIMADRAAASQAIASQIAASQAVTSQAADSQTVGSQQSALNSQQLGSDQLGSSILADLDEDFAGPFMNAVEESGWVSSGTIHAFKYKFKAGVTNRNKIAAFDLDGTLITTRSNGKFSRDINDWKLKDASLKTRIQVLVKGGFNFVIFSNQMGVSCWYFTLQQMKSKFENIVKHIDQPCVALFCTSLDGGRKPAIGMLDFYQTINSTKLNLQQSFFVGDSMGRPRDHSAADLLFAFNCRMPFISIESFLNGGLQTSKLYNYEELSKFRIPAYPIDLAKQKAPQILSKKKKAPGEAESDFFSCEELIDSIEDELNRLKPSNGSQLCVMLLIGLFGSGKSHFARKHLPPSGYQVIEQEIGRSLEEERSLFKRYVEEGKKRIVIDQPNLDFNERKRWIDLAKAERAVVIGLYFDLPLDQCSHNVRFRSFYTGYNRRAPTPNRILAQHLAFRAPEFFEGFNEIYKLDFIPSFDEPQKNIYYSHFLYDTRC